jgi:hypothetical protein
VTADSKYALVVDGYELTEDETAATTTSVTFPDPEEEQWKRHYKDYP